jgi:hypothetical protein
MTPIEKAPAGPEMMQCTPYAATISRLQCVINQRRPLHQCLTCQTGSRVRKDYPGLMRKAAAMLNKSLLQCAANQHALRRLSSGQIAADRDRRDKPRAGLKVG